MRTNSIGACWFPIFLASVLTGCHITPPFWWGASRISDEQYLVYSAYLQVQLQKGSPDTVRVGPRESFISPLIDAAPKLPEETRAYLRLHAPGLDPVMLDAFDTCSQRPYTMEPKFQLPVKYQLATAEEPAGPRGSLHFSCIGFNAAQDQALFEVQRIHCTCAVGRWIWMKRNSDGRWTVFKEVRAWGT